MLIGWPTWSPGATSDRRIAWKYLEVSGSAVAGSFLQVFADHEAMPCRARLYIFNLKWTPGTPSKDWFSLEGPKSLHYIAFNVQTDPSKGQAVLPKVLTGSTNLDELGGLEKLFCCVVNHFADLCGSRDRFGDSMTQHLWFDPGVLRCGWWVWTPSRQESCQGLAPKILDAEFALEIVLLWFI